MAAAEGPVPRPRSLDGGGGCPGQEQAGHDRWLSLTVEPPIEPGLPIVDPHHHLWYKHPQRSHVASFLLEEMAADCGTCGHNITGTVYMQSSSAGWKRAGGAEHLKVVGETEAMQGVAAMSESGLYGPTRVCAGIVGTVDLLLGAERVEEVLLAHMRVSRNFRGVRFMGGKAEQIPFSDGAFRAGVAVVDRLGLVLDVNGPETHPLDFGVLSGIVDLARAFPTLTLVVDHCGGAIGPGCFDGDPQARCEWEGHIDALRDCPNVVMKVGGLHMPQNGFPIGPADRAQPVDSEALAAMIGPYYERVIRAFGPRRCMFESNFPVDKWGVSYGVLWNSFKRVAVKMALSAEDKHLLFHDTAVRVYGLQGVSGCEQGC